MPRRPSKSVLKSGQTLLGSVWPAFIIDETFSPIRVRTLMSSVVGVCRFFTDRTSDRSFWSDGSSTMVGSVRFDSMGCMTRVVNEAVTALTKMSQ